MRRFCINRAWQIDYHHYSEITMFRLPQCCRFFQPVVTAKLSISQLIQNSHWLLSLCFSLWTGNLKNHSFPLQKPGWAVRFKGKWMDIRGMYHMKCSTASPTNADEGHVFGCASRQWMCQNSPFATTDLIGCHFCHTRCVGAFALNTGAAVK